MICDNCSKLGIDYELAEKDFVSHAAIHENHIKLISDLFNQDQTEKANAADANETIIDEAPVKDDSIEVIDPNESNEDNGKNTENGSVSKGFMDQCHDILVQLINLRGREYASCRLCSTVIGRRGVRVDLAVNHALSAHMNMLFECKSCDYKLVPLWGIKRHDRQAHKRNRNLGEFIDEKGADRDLILRRFEECYGQTAVDDERNGGTSNANADANSQNGKRKMPADAEIVEKKPRVIPPLQMVTRSLTRKAIVINLTESEDRKDESIRLMPVFKIPTVPPLSATIGIKREPEKDSGDASGLIPNANENALPKKSTTVGIVPKQETDSGTSSGFTTAIDKRGHYKYNLLFHLIKQFAKRKTMCCYECSEWIDFNAPRDLTGHAFRAHLKLSLFCCRNCSATYSDLRNMTTHLRNAHRLSATDGYDDHRQEYNDQINECLSKCYDASKRQPKENVKPVAAQSSASPQGGESSKVSVDMTGVTETVGRNGRIIYKCCWLKTEIVAVMRCHRMAFHKKVQ